MNISTGSLCVCYENPPGWNTTLSNYIAFVSLGIILIQFVYFGVLFGTRSKIVFFTNILIFYILYYALWRIEILSQILRPIAVSGTCAVLSASPNCANSWLYDLMNKYAFPDPLFITSFAFAIAFLYSEIVIYKKEPAYIFITLLILFFILFSISEIALNRMTIGQYFGNFALFVVVSTLLILFANIFLQAFPMYQSEVDASIKIEVERQRLYNAELQLLRGKYNMEWGNGFF